MKISIQVKTNSKESRVEEIGPHRFQVNVKSPPHENKANREAIEVLAEYFRLPKSRLSIVSGLKSKQKIVSLEKDE